VSGIVGADAGGREGPVGARKRPRRGDSAAIRGDVSVQAARRIVRGAEVWRLTAVRLGVERALVAGARRVVLRLALGVAPVVVRRVVARRFGAALDLVVARRLAVVRAVV
jgi:hypothetical protein